MSSSNNSMNPWPIRTAATLAEFSNSISELQPHWPNKAEWMFRGQMRADWQLEPSISRLFKGQGLSVQKLASIEKDLRLAFYREAHRFVDPQCFTIPFDNVWQWWAIMRHYGSPTRTLDWSHSPYVALYFAVEGDWSTNGTVWCVKGKSIGSCFKKSDERAYKETHKNRSATRGNPFCEPNDHSFLYLYDMSFQIDRIAAQQGRFTVSTDGLSDHGKLLATSLPGEDILKIVIPAESKPQMLRELHLMNIAAKALFPGIDGLGRSLQDRARLSIKFDRPAPPTDGSIEG